MKHHHSKAIVDGFFARSTTPTEGKPKPTVNDAPSRVLRLPAVLLATGLGRSTVYRMIAERTFPAPVKLAKRAVGWRHYDVRRWTAGRPSTQR